MKCNVWQARLILLFDEKCSWNQYCVWDHGTIKPPWDSTWHFRKRLYANQENASPKAHSNVKSNFPSFCFIIKRHLDCKLVRIFRIKIHDIYIFFTLWRKPFPHLSSFVFQSWCSETAVHPKLHYLAWLTKWISLGCCGNGIRVHTLWSGETKQHRRSLKNGNLYHRSLHGVTSSHMWFSVASDKGVICILYVSEWHITYIHN